jgi:3(or 17)beta-hydroxysteroid dehydrogenase
MGIGEPLDVANMVLFLASDESKHINGAELVIDNGATAGDISG